MSVPRNAMGRSADSEDGLSSGVAKYLRGLYHEVDRRVHDQYLGHHVDSLSQKERYKNSELLAVESGYQLFPYLRPEVVHGRCFTSETEAMHAMNDEAQAQNKRMHDEANNQLRKQLSQDYVSFCQSEFRRRHDGPYRLYQDIVNELDRVKDTFVKKYCESSNMYETFTQLCTKLQQTQVTYRDKIFGAAFVKQLADKVNDKNNHKRCPSCRTPWCDDGGCRYRRCGHQNAPNLDREYIEVPKRGKCGKKSGCGKKFEWAFGEPLSDAEFFAFWAPTQQQIDPEKEKCRLARVRIRSRSPRRSPCDGTIGVYEGVPMDISTSQSPLDNGERSFVPIKQESVDDRPVFCEVPAVMGWDVELVYMPTTRDGVVTIFTETPCDRADPKCFLPRTSFLRLDGSVVDVADLRASEKLQGPSGEVIVDSVTPHYGSDHSLVHVTLAHGSFTVTKDHRMCLPHGIYRRACSLRIGELVSTNLGDQAILTVHQTKENVPVYAVCFHEDRAAFMGMPPLEGTMIAAFGTPFKMDGTKYMHFKFKGEVCRAAASGFVAETWLTKFSDNLNMFDMLFQATDPYSVWVRRDHADAFYGKVKSLLVSHAPGRSRIRKHQSKPSEERALDDERAAAWPDTDDGY